MTRESEDGAMLPLLLVLAFLVLPALEIFLLVLVGSMIGAWATLGVLAVQGLLGAWIVRREGRRAWQALEGALRGGAQPDREPADSALAMTGGMLLLTPGFVTDVFALVFLLPFTRPLVRRALSALTARRMRAAEARGRASAMYPPGFSPFGRPPGGGQDEGPTDAPSGPVVRGEVIHEDDPASRP